MTACRCVSLSAICLGVYVCHYKQMLLFCALGWSWSVPATKVTIVTAARAQLGAMGRTPILNFILLAKGLSQSCNTFYTWTKAMYYFVLAITNIPAQPSQNYPAAPLNSSTSTIHYQCCCHHYFLRCFTSIARIIIYLKDFVPFNRKAASISNLTAGGMQATAATTQEIQNHRL